MNNIDYCEVDSGNNITSCNVALLIRVRNFSAISSGIDGMYPLPSVKNSRLPNTSYHPLDTGGESEYRQRDELQHQRAVMSENRKFHMKNFKQ
jgi:hypothetical protein